VLRRGVSVLTLTAFAVTLALGSQHDASADEQTVYRASVAADGSDTNGPSGAPLLSADGNVVVYQSSASDLAAGDGNGLDDVFAFDRSTGSVSLVSANTGGAAANGPSTPLAVSSDGRFVVFASTASDLTSDVLPGGCAPQDGCNPEIFIRDLASGTTELVSRALDGQPANLPSGAAAVSADGHAVAFASYASNLVPGDTNRAADIFVRDRRAGTTRRISVGPGGVQANGASDTEIVSMTPDGRVIAFSSTASNLGARDTPGTWDVFIRDRAVAATRRMSQYRDGRSGLGRSLFPTISDSGLQVAFMSMAPFASGDRSGSWDIYVKSRSTGLLARVPLTTTGLPRISGDGHWIGFPSNDERLPGLPGRSEQAVVWDRIAHHATIASLAGSAPSTGRVTAVSVSRDGSAAAFDTTGADIAPLDANGTVDIYLRILRPAA
jgi:Tol biopolymer transport system component